MKTIKLVFYLSTLCCVELIASQRNFTLINKLEHSNEEFSSDQNKGNVCRKNLPFIWCIPSYYNNEVEPWQYRDITNTSLPWMYHIYFFINPYV